ncbi:MAG: hypothetical protein LBL30_01715 [Holosporales bacterium]|jgi:hypothetical protein|nr:hypothetical protein [Holosporales bacterium]
MLGFARILLIVCFWLVGSGALEAYASTVVVKDVFVKAEDKSATKAKDQALRQGEALAVSEAIQAMAEPNQNIGSIGSSIRSPSAYISDFTINEEKITPTAYEAFVTYRLAKDRLIKLFIDKNVRLKPEAERIASIKAKDLYGKEVVIESLDGTSSGRLKHTPSGSDKNLGQSGAEQQVTVIKIRTRSVKDWLDLSPVLASFFESTTVYVSANLTILEAANIVIDDNLIKAVSERGFNLTVLPDKTVVVSIKEALTGDREANTAAQPPSSAVYEAGVGNTI